MKFGQVGYAEATGNGATTIPPPPATVEDTLIGIEVEMEVPPARRLRPPPLEGFMWRRVEEGSLRRGGLEWVSSEPAPLRFASAMLAQLRPYFEGMNDSWRAAVHVHVDCRWMDRLQFLTAYLHAIARDSQIFELVGNGRDQSNFCVPALHNLRTANQLVHAMKAQDAYAWRHALANHAKYTSINLKRYCDLGTMEFRHMQTPHNSDPVLSINQIHSFAKHVVRVTVKAALHVRRGLRGTDFITYLNDLPRKFAVPEYRDAIMSSPIPNDALVQLSSVLLPLYSDAPRAPTVSISKVGSLLSRRDTSFERSQRARARRFVDVYASLYDDHPMEEGE